MDQIFFPKSFPVFNYRISIFRRENQNYNVATSDNILERLKLHLSAGGAGQMCDRSDSHHNSCRTVPGKKNYPLFFRTKK